MTRRQQIALELLVALPLLWACGSRHPPETLSAPPSPAVLAETMEHAIEVQEAPGAILGLRDKSGNTQIIAVGLADLESGRPMQITDPFFLGSVSKMFTATAVLQLVEEGLVGLDQALSDFLPEFPNAENITLRQLLQHSSGLQDVAVWAYFRPDREEMLHAVTRNWTVGEMIETAATLEPMFEPGGDWAYSNTNYLLLGSVVEVVTGQALAERIRQQILAPLGLETTWLNNWEPPRADLPITGYLGSLPFWSHSEMFGELGPTTGLDQGTLEWGSGGMASTATESLAFLDALLGAQVLPPAALLEMLDWLPTPALGAPGPETPADLESGYGLGIARQVRPGYTMVGHGGIYNGHTAGLWRLEECEATVALYVNRGFIDARWVMDRIAEAVGCGPGAPTTTGSAP